MLDKDFLRQLWAYRTESADLAVVTSAVTTLSFLLLLAAVRHCAGSSPHSLTTSSCPCDAHRQCQCRPERAVLVSRAARHGTAASSTPSPRLAARARRLTAMLCPDTPSAPAGLACLACAVRLSAQVVALADAFEERSGHKASKTLLVPSFLFASALVVLDLTFYAGQVRLLAAPVDLCAACRSGGRLSLVAHLHDMMSAAAGCRR